jgi:hypothetical protein
LTGALGEGCFRGFRAIESANGTPFDAKKEPPGRESRQDVFFGREVQSYHWHFYEARFSGFLESCFAGNWAVV